MAFIAAWIAFGFLNAFGTFQAYYKLQYLPQLYVCQEAEWWFQS